MSSATGRTTLLVHSFWAPPVNRRDQCFSPITIHTCGMGTNVLGKVWKMFQICARSSSNFGLTFRIGTSLLKYSRTWVKDHLGQETTLLLRPLFTSPVQFFLYNLIKSNCLGIKTTFLFTTPKGGLYIKVRLYRILAPLSCFAQWSLGFMHW